MIPRDPGPKRTYPGPEPKYCPWCRATQAMTAVEDGGFDNRTGERRSPSKYRCPRCGRVLVRVQTGGGHYWGTPPTEGLRKDGHS